MSSKKAENLYHPRTVIRYADVCPACAAVNSLILNRGFLPSTDGVRQAYGICKSCGHRVVIREIVK